MKTDLATAIGAAIAGLVIAYFITNLFIGPIADVTYKTITTKTDASVTDPDPEIFNYRAVNPTVEVYVGQCESYDENGNCIVDSEIIVDPNQVPNNNNNGESNGGTN